MFIGEIDDILKGITKGSHKLKIHQMVKTSSIVQVQMSNIHIVHKIGN